MGETINKAQRNSEYTAKPSAWDNYWDEPVPYEQEFEQNQMSDELDDALLLDDVDGDLVPEKDPIPEKALPYKTKNKDKRKRTTVKAKTKIDNRELLIRTLMALLKIRYSHAQELVYSGKYDWTNPKYSIKGGMQENVLTDKHLQADNTYQITISIKYDSYVRMMHISDQGTTPEKYAAIADKIWMDLPDLQQYYDKALREYNRLDYAYRTPAAKSPFEDNGQQNQSEHIDTPPQQIDFTLNLAYLEWTQQTKQAFLDKYPRLHPSIFPSAPTEWQLLMQLVDENKANEQSTLPDQAWHFVIAELAARYTRSAVTSARVAIIKDLGERNTLAKTIVGYDAFMLKHFQEAALAGLISSDLQSAFLAAQSAMLVIEAQETEETMAAKGEELRPVLVRFYKAFYAEVEPYTESHTETVKWRQETGVRHYKTNPYLHPNRLKSIINTTEEAKSEDEWREAISTFYNTREKLAKYVNAQLEKSPEALSPDFRPSESLKAITHLSGKLTEFMSKHPDAIHINARFIPGHKLAPSKNFDTERIQREGIPLRMYLHRQKDEWVLTDMTNPDEPKVNEHDGSLDTLFEELNSKLRFPPGIIMWEIPDLSESTNKIIVGETITKAERSLSEWLTAIGMVIVGGALVATGVGSVIGAPMLVAAGTMVALGGGVIAAGGAIANSMEHAEHGMLTAEVVLLDAATVISVFAGGIGAMGKMAIAGRLGAGIAASTRIAQAASYFYKPLMITSLSADFVTVLVMSDMAVEQYEQISSITNTRAREAAMQRLVTSLAMTGGLFLIGTRSTLKDLKEGALPPATLDVDKMVLRINDHEISIRTSEEGIHPQRAAADGTNQGATPASSGSSAKAATVIDEELFARLKKKVANAEEASLLRGDLKKKEFADALEGDESIIVAWRLLKNHPRLRVRPQNLTNLQLIAPKFSYKGQTGQAALGEFLNGHRSIQKLLDNLARVEMLFGSVPGIQYTGTKASPIVRIVGNDAININVKSRSELDLFEVVDPANPQFFTTELLMSFELQFEGITMRAERVRIGTTNREKIAIIAQSMGGTKMREHPDTGVTQRMYGVKDFSNTLVSLGYKTELFVPGKRKHVPTLSDEAMKQLEKKQKRYNMAHGLPPNTLLPYDEVVGTLAWQEDKIWADYVRDNGYTLIDLGNPHNLKIKSPFYDVEAESWFGKK